MKQSNGGQEAVEREAAQVKGHVTNGNLEEPQKCDKSDEEEVAKKDDATLEEEEEEEEKEKEKKPDEKDTKEEAEEEVATEEQEEEVGAEAALQVDFQIDETTNLLGTTGGDVKPEKEESKTDEENVATEENVDDKKPDEEEELEEEDDRLSTTSSPSALHIHLEDDKDEPTSNYSVLERSPSPLIFIRLNHLFKFSRVYCVFLNTWNIVEDLFNDQIPFLQRSLTFMIIFETTYPSQLSAVQHMEHHRRLDK